MKRARQLTAGLVISGMMNIGLGLSLFLVWRGSASPILSLEEIEAKAEVIQEPGKAARLLELQQKTYDQLVAVLQDSGQVEDGFSRRDLALGCLVSKHHFPISKALPGISLQPRHFLAGQERIVLFSGLKEEHFKKVVDFAETEKWPLTAQGLFLKLKDPVFRKEPSLRAVFAMTSEYGSVETLIRACGFDISREQIIQMISEGGWQQLQEASKESELSNTRLQRVLLSYVDNCSPAAADIFVHAYPDYALKKLDDQTVITVLRQLKSPTPAAENYAKELLLSPRSRAVWQAAAARLYQFKGEAPPKTFDYKATVSRFITTRKAVTAPLPAVAQKAPSPVVEKKAVAPKKEAKKQFLHVVRQGESLWTIAKQYHIEGEQLKSVNSLKNDKIREGQVLVIP